MQAARLGSAKAMRAIGIPSVLPTIQKKVGRASTGVTEAAHSHDKCAGTSNEKHKGESASGQKITALPL